jgi:isocitrate dehydrogenase (NAD+)
MSQHTVTLIPGDGVGPEVADATRRTIDATGVPINWEVQNAGADVVAQYGTPLPPHVVDSIRRNGTASFLTTSTGHVA